MPDNNACSTKYDAVIIGAGFSGLYQLYRLRELGLKVRVCETGGGVGGTWYWNRYPGCRVDSQAYIYQYFFSDELLNEWEWSELFPAQPETERYLNFVADKFELRKDISFNTRVEAAEYDESTQRWKVRTDTGEILDTQYLVGCAGLLSAPIVPFEGKDDFQGMICHTSSWPQERVDFSGKRVGVVGTGATGIQVTQSVAPLAGNLKVFQRTPAYTIAIRNPEFSDADNQALRERYPEIKKQINETFAGFPFDFENGAFHDHPPEVRREVYEKLWQEGSLNFWLGTFFEIFVDEEANAEISEFVREKIRERVKDPELAEKLTPTEYGFGTRRVPLDTGYFETFERDNVELVDVKADAIERITEKGLKLASGEEHELDILILATGFDGGTGPLSRIDIRGRNGLSLKEKWDADIRTTLGLQMHGFPNLFTIGAPLAPVSAFCNVATCLAHQAEWITDCIAYMRDKGLNVIEPTKAKEDAWVSHHDELVNTTLIPKTDSWYTGTNVEGKSRRVIAYIGGVPQYRMVCDELKENDYEGFELA